MPRGPKPPPAAWVAAKAVPAGDGGDDVLPPNADPGVPDGDLEAPPPNAAEAPLPKEPQPVDDGNVSMAPASRMTQHNTVLLDFWLKAQEKELTQTLAASTARKSSLGLLVSHRVAGWL